MEGPTTRQLGGTWSFRDVAFRTPATAGSLVKESLRRRLFRTPATAGSLVKYLLRFAYPHPEAATKSTSRPPQWAASNKGGEGRLRVARAAIRRRRLGVLAADLRNSDLSVR